MGCVGLVSFITHPLTEYLRGVEAFAKRTGRMGSVLVQKSRAEFPG